MKEKKKKVYETLFTERLRVETESGFCVGSIGDEPTDTESITIEEQTPGVQIGGTGEGWDNDERWNSDKWD